MAPPGVSQKTILHLASRTGKFLFLFCNFLTADGFVNYAAFTRPICAHSFAIKAVYSCINKHVFKSRFSVIDTLIIAQVKAISSHGSILNGDISPGQF